MQVILYTNRVKIIILNIVMWKRKWNCQQSYAHNWINLLSIYYKLFLLWGQN